MSDVRMSPYELFGLPETYALDEMLLAERHRAAMQKVHPDRFADRSAAERRVAEQWSAVINEAFETLKSPVKRAVWLAKKRGAEVETEGQVRMPADFLMKQLDWRERLEEADETERSALLEEVESEAKSLEAALEAAFDRENDPVCGADLARRLLFIVKFLQDARRASA